MKKTFLINDLVWIGFGTLVCWGGLRMGFGSFTQPGAGFMPFLAGLALGLLALGDLISGLIRRWGEEKGDSEIWGNIYWGKLLLTMSVLFFYTVFLTTVGFLIATFFLLIYLYQVMEPKPWKWVIFVSILTTIITYVAFKVGLDTQLPRGLLGI
jgi:uncharacterized BrkB/YihY/UPF0761 family membrane protein